MQQKPQTQIQVSKGAGMITGLEIWSTPTNQFILVDRSADGRFANDVSLWNSAIATVGLNTKARKKRKDAKK